ncbi:MAG: class I SAM-dependent methyltransferase [Pseudomonadota bacterium]
MELGAAEGDIACLIAFGEAKKVYVNDISEQEMRIFEDTKKQFPAYVKNKLESICCDYKDILMRKPELRGACDFVLFRNGFHFLRDADYPSFFDLLRTVLKPGGQIIMTANSINIMIIKEMNRNSEIQQAFVSQDVSQHPTRFSNAVVRIQNHITKTETEIFRETSLCHEDLLPIGFEKSAVCVRKQGGNWGRSKKETGKITDAALRTRIVAKIDEHSGDLAKIHVGEVLYLTNTSRYFAPANLIHLFANHGLETLGTLVFNSKGHTVARLTNNANTKAIASEDARDIVRLGIIARFPS